jgi:hypothetical protein
VACRVPGLWASVRPAADHARIVRQTAHRSTDGTLAELGTQISFARAAGLSRKLAGTTATAGAGAQRGGRYGGAACLACLAPTARWGRDNPARTRWERTPPRNRRPQTSAAALVGQPAGQLVVTLGSQPSCSAADRRPSRVSPRISSPRKWVSHVANTRGVGGRRACKGSCNEPQDATASHDTLSRENRTQRHQRRA